MRSGDEYLYAVGAFEITSHPGVTARHGDAMLIPGRNLMGHCSRHNMAAGVVTQAASCAGFIADKIRGIDKYGKWMLSDTLYENDQPWLYGVTAHKAYFWFDDQIVMLGCGINNRRRDFRAEIRTTIDQTLVKDFRRGELDIVATDTLIRLKDSMEQAGAIHVRNNGFVYQILSAETPGEVWLSTGSRATRWDDLNIRNPEVQNKPGEVNIFQLWINHGMDPVDDRYAYRVYCGRDNVLPPVPDILVNSTRVQAMSSSDGSVVQAIFYKADTLRTQEQLFYLSAPCAFSARFIEDALEFTVSDASMNTALDTITVTTSLPIKEAVRNGVFYKVGIPLPTGKNRGKQGSRIFTF
jgi:chondroitin AC lyase